MEINNMKALSFEELRVLYKKILHSQNISKATINTAYVNTMDCQISRGMKKFLDNCSWGTVKILNGVKIEII